MGSNVRMACLYLVLITMSIALSEASSSITKPNLILVMCDDLDKLLGGENAIPQVKKLLGEGGADASNYFVSSPKCTPSRSAWLSGRHYHNLRPNGATTGAGLNTSNFFDRDAIFPTLRRAGYQTGLFGKLHNDQGRWLCTPSNNTDPFDHVETECSPCGGYYRTGKNEWVHKNTHDSVPYFETLDPLSPWSNYSEAQYGNRTLDWIKNVYAKGPFFAFIGTSGPHLGVIPAPWHRFRTSNITVTAPRTPNFNYQARDHHPLLATAPVLDSTAISAVDEIFRDRWGTLFSIDDMVAKIVEGLNNLGIRNSTYIMFTSDHGYHLGQFRLPDEKMTPYETDVRVPFYAFGPGITPGTVVDELISNIDIAPTLCDLAGIDVPTIMDGRSLVPLLLNQPNRLMRPWRTHFMIEFAEGGFQEWGTNKYWKYDPFGPVVDLEVMPPYGPGCNTQHDCCGTGSDPSILPSGLSSPCPKNKCPVATSCPNSTRFDYQYDDPTYNWRGLRVLNASHNFIFVQFDPTYMFDKPNDRNSTIKPAKYMPDVNINGEDEPSPCPLAPAANNWTACQETCKSTLGCLGWTLHFNDPRNKAPGWRCCTKFTIVDLEHASPTVISGVLNPSQRTSSIAFTEFFDIHEDPWQMRNIWNSLEEGVQQSLKNEIDARFACRGTRVTASTCE